MKKNKISEATPSVTHRKAARKLIPCALLCSFTIAWMPLAITTPALAVSEEIVVASVNPSEKDGLRQGASNLLSGNLSLPLTLGSVTLTINTQSRFDQGFGPGASFAPSIKALSATEHLYTSSAGRSSLFRSGASMFTAAGDLRKLSTVESSTIKIDGRASDYSLFTRAGNSQEFLIAEATDSFGAKTTFAYQAVGQKYLISKIVNSIGKETTFHVDNGRIARIDTPYEQFSLQYNSSGFLTAVLNQRGERLFYLERDNEYNLPISLSYRNNAGENELQFFSYTVDPTSKKAVLRAAGNALGTIQYAYHPDKTISRTSQGEVAEYNSVQTPLGARVSSVVAYVKDGAKTISTTSYDPQGRVAQQKDFAGWTTSYTYSGQNPNPSSITTEFYNTALIYNDDFRLVSASTQYKDGTSRIATHKWQGAQHLLTAITVNSEKMYEQNKSYVDAHTQRLASRDTWQHAKYEYSGALDDAVRVASASFIQPAYAAGASGATVSMLTARGKMESTTEPNSSVVTVDGFQASQRSQWRADGGRETNSNSPWSTVVSTSATNGGVSTFTSTTNTKSPSGSAVASVTSTSTQTTGPDGSTSSTGTCESLFDKVVATDSCTPTDNGARFATSSSHIPSSPGCTPYGAPGSLGQKCGVADIS